MMKLGLLMIGAATISTIPGCMAESPADDADQSQATEELVATPGVTANGFGTFGPIHLANTSLCLQPVGESTGDVPIELRGCNGRVAQNWFVANHPSKGYSIINQNNTNKCIYNNAPLPLADRGQPILQADCLLAGTPNTVSNALWKPIAVAGNMTFMSRVQFRDTGFCLDVPFGIPYEGAQLWMWHCNGTAAQQWILD
jgi:hypothetical protein